MATSYEKDIQQGGESGAETAAGQVHTSRLASIIQAPLSASHCQQVTNPCPQISQIKEDVVYRNQR
jgi:hypothetical protein